MRIGIISTGYPPARIEGGLSHYTRCLVQHLSHLDHEVVVLTGGDYLGNPTEGRVTVVPWAGGWGVGSLREMIALFTSREIDLLNLQYTPGMYPLSFKLAWPIFTRHFPTVVSLHTLWGGSRVNYLAALLLVRYSRAIIATNSEILYLLKRYLPWGLRKTRYIPIGPNIGKADSSEVFGPLPEKFTGKEGQAVITFFGMLYPGKGLHRLLDVAKTLAGERDLDFRLLIVGGGLSDNPWYRQEMLGLTRQWGLEDKVTWTGSLPAAEVSRVLTASDLVLLPFEGGVSDRRGSLMAALSHGKAVVTTRPAIPIDDFRNGENMVWPAQPDSASLAQAALSVLRDHGLRRRLEAGASELASRFQWRKIAEETARLFAGVAQTEGRATWGSHR